MYDMDNEMTRITKSKKYFSTMLGKKTHLIIYNPTKAVKKKKYKNTTYYFFEAKIISKEGKPVLQRKYLIQLPAKSMYYNLYKMLEIKDKLQVDEICITVYKHDNHNYEIILHD